TSVAHASFSTLASGTPTIPKSPYGPTSGKGTLQQDIVGSAALAGTLTGALPGKGKPTLTNKGKPVTVLKSGRYKVAISDQTKKGAFVVEAVNGGTVKDLTAAPFRRSVTLELTPGRWMYYANRSKPYFFLVTR